VFLSDTAEKEINSQSEERKEQHQQLLKDLKKIQNQASKIWTDIGKLLFFNEGFNIMLT